MLSLSKGLLLFQGPSATIQLSSYHWPDVQLILTRYPAVTVLMSRCTISEVEWPLSSCSGHAVNVHRYICHCPEVKRLLPRSPLATVQRLIQWPPYSCRGHAVNIYRSMCHCPGYKELLPRGPLATVQRLVQRPPYSCRGHAVNIYRSICHCQQVKGLLPRGPRATVRGWFKGHHIAAEVMLSLSQV